jgi:hypothetical protein
MRKKYISECISLVQQTMQIIEEDYRKCIQDKTKLLEPKIEPYEKPAPKSIKLKIIDETIQDDIEYVSYSLYDPKKTAYFRLSVVVEII